MLQHLGLLWCYLAGAVLQQCSLTHDQKRPTTRHIKCKVCWYGLRRDRFSKRYKGKRWKWENVSNSHFFSCFPKIHNDICFNEDVRPISLFKSPCKWLFLVLHQVPMWLWFHKIRIPLVRMKVMINLAAKFGNHAQTDMLEIIAAHNGNVLSECSSLLLVRISGISIL